MGTPFSAKGFDVLSCLFPCQRFLEQHLLGEASHSELERRIEVERKVDAELSWEWGHLVNRREETVEWCWDFTKEANKLASLSEKGNSFDVLGNKVEILNFMGWRNRATQFRTFQKDSHSCFYWCYPKSRSDFKIASMYRKGQECKHIYFINFIIFCTVTVVDSRCFHVDLGCTFLRLM